jgi:DNA-binding IclR family transcriptional regulator
MTAQTTVPAQGRPNLSAIGKATAIVEALADSSQLTDIARRVGLPTSSTHRILHELAELGWVEKTIVQGRRTYRVTDHLRGLLAASVHRGRRRPRATPALATPGGNR